MNIFDYLNNDWTMLYCSPDSDVGYAALMMAKRASIFKDARILHVAISLSDIPRFGKLAEACVILGIAHIHVDRHLPDNAWYMVDQTSKSIFYARGPNEKN